MRRTATAIGIILLAALAGCKSTTTAAGSAPTATGGATATGTHPATTPATASAGPTAAGQTGAATTKVDPCSLLTAADLSGALGGSLGAGTSAPAGVYQACVYRKAKVVVLVRNIDKTTFDKSAAANPGSVKQISGIGSDAYVSADTILAWKDGSEVVIRVEGGTLAVVKKLATAAAGRL